MYRIRVDEEIDSNGDVLSRKLIQIWFTHLELLEAIARFISDFLLIIDGTFNTNDKRMPILIAIGVLNTN